MLLTRKSIAVCRIGSLLRQPNTGKMLLFCLGLLGLLGQHPAICMADEPPLRPRTPVWNSYFSRYQFLQNDPCDCAQCRTGLISGVGLPGLAGRPYVDQRLECRNRSCPLRGDCHCQPSGSAFASASPHWPRPFSAFWDQQFPGDCCPHALHDSGMATRKSCGHLFDRLDPLADIKLLPNVRTDSGYRGPECDPYGKVGLSHYARFAPDAARTGPTSHGTNNPQITDHRPQPAVMQTHYLESLPFSAAADPEPRKLGLEHREHSDAGRWYRGEVHQRTQPRASNTVQAPHRRPVPARPNPAPIPRRSLVTPENQPDTRTHSLWQGYGAR